MVDLSIAMLVYQRVKTVKQLDFDKADGNFHSEQKMGCKSPKRAEILRLPKMFVLAVKKCQIYECLRLRWLVLSLVGVSTIVTPHLGQFRSCTTLRNRRNANRPSWSMWGKRRFQVAWLHGFRFKSSGETLIQLVLEKAEIHREPYCKGLFWTVP